MYLILPIRFSKIIQHSFLFLILGNYTFYFAGEIVKTKWLEGPMYNAQWDLLYYADKHRYLAEDYDYIYEDDREPKDQPERPAGGNKQKSPK